MKANEAPEKIYLQPSTISTIEQLSYQNFVYTKPLADNSIEYTRTEAFIEKAAQWLFNQANIYTDIEIDRNNGGVYTKFHADEMVKDFIKAMKL